MSTLHASHTVTVTVTLTLYQARSIDRFDPSATPLALPHPTIPIHLA